MNINEALLISFVTSTTDRMLSETEIGSLLGFVKAVANSYSGVELENLMDAMKNGRKIETIKSYRTLTGSGLKEAKDAIEKYWVSKPMPATDVSVKFGG